MDRLGILYSEGFTGTVTRRFNPSAYDLDYYYPGELGEGRVRRYHKVAHLYKLHGSTNWRKSPEPLALNRRAATHRATTTNTGEGWLIGNHAHETTTFDRRMSIFRRRYNEKTKDSPQRKNNGRDISRPYVHMNRELYLLSTQHSALGTQHCS